MSDCVGRHILVRCPVCKKCQIRTAAGFRPGTWPIVSARLASTQVSSVRKTSPPVLHVSRSAVGNWETGENKPSYLALLRWSEVTGVPLAWIQHGVDFIDDDGGGGPSVPVTLGYLADITDGYQADRELIAA